MARAVLLLGCLAGAILPAAVGAVRNASAAIEELARAGSGDVWPIALAAAAFAAVAVAFARAWPARFPDAVFLALAGLVFLAGKLAYVHLVEIAPTSDFRGMWNMASAVAERGGEVVPTAPLFSVRLHFERTLPYLLPLRVLFGPENSSFEVANVLAGLMASVVAYGLARTWFGRAAGRVAFTVANVPVETWLAAAVPTHDIPGALFTITALALFVLLDRSLRRGRLVQASTLSLAVGVSLVVIDLQRTTGLLVFLAGALVVGLAQLLDRRTTGVRLPRNVLASLALVVALPAAVLAGGSELLERAELTVPDEMMSRQSAIALAAYSDSWGIGHYSEYRPWAAVYGSSEQVTHELVVRKYLSDVRYSPLERFPNALRKAARLYELGRQLNVYLRGAVVGDAEVGPRTVWKVHLFNRLFVAAFLGLFVVATIRLWGPSPPPLVALLPLVFLAMLSGALILIGETQPRYLYQIWSVAPIYLGSLLGGGSGGRDIGDTDV